MTNRIESPARRGVLLRTTSVGLGAAGLLPCSGVRAASPEATADDSARLTSLATILAGRPSSFSAHQKFQSYASWRQHQEEAAFAWSQMKIRRVAPIIQWRDRQLSSEKISKALLYPFSGADFLNAYLFFPKNEQYVMFGLEPAGDAPDLGSMTEQQADAFLSSMRLAIHDLVQRNYFITERMLKQLNNASIRGVAPLIIATMGLLELKIKSVKPHVLKAPSSKEQGKRPVNGVRIVFRDPAKSFDQTLDYYSLDATDDALAKTPEFIEYLSGFTSATTMLKSASYLLHGPYFSRVRTTLLSASRMIVQDDTGVPYKVLLEGGWKVRLHGDYEKPIKDFGKFGYQPDLERAYREQKTEPLPFPFGYHWSNGKSSLLVATR
jgi:hypothetical protein